MSVGERIYKLRKMAGFSQGQLANKMGVTRQAVSKWETDQSTPDPLRLIQLCDVLDTDVSFLATGKSTVAESQEATTAAVSESPKVIEHVKTVYVPQEKVYEKVVEKPVVKKVLRYRYLRNPIEYAAVAIVGFLFGLLVGIIL